MTSFRMIELEFQISKAYESIDAVLLISHSIHHTSWSDANSCILYFTEDTVLCHHDLLTTGGETIQTLSLH